MSIFRTKMSENELVKIIENSELTNEDWYIITRSQVLSELFMEKFQDKVDLYWLPLYQVLSEEFIEQFQNKLGWHIISLCQDLSEEFINKWRSKIDFGNLSVNEHIIRRKTAELIAWNIETVNKYTRDRFSLDLSKVVCRLIYR